MAIDPKELVRVLKQKREAKGLSLRGLSPVIGVSFSTLARIERGEGEPDNNSLIRILEWLGDDAQQAGLSFEEVAFVHFRAAKNIRSETVHCLLQVADILRRNYLANNPEPLSGDVSEALESNFPTPRATIFTKPEMEEMAGQFRADLGFTDSDPLDALGIIVDGVTVFVPSDISGLSQRCRSHLTTTGATDWSAMSVPLDRSEDRWAILRNDQHNLERQRVTYLEECWHILLGHKLTKIAKVADAYGRTYESHEEDNAFYLASACMLPESAIRRALVEGQSASDISSHFGVSTQLVEYRIKRLGLWPVYQRRSVKLAIP